MKITLILLLTTAFSAFSMDVHSQNAKVSLDTNIMKVAQLISAIESQTNYLFVYSKKNVDLSRKVKINAKNKAVSEILDEVFSGTGITYVMEGKNIVLTKESNIAREEVKQQNTITVKGAITDMQGEAIIGANIIQQGTTNGTITDIDGNFTLEVPADAQLVISYIGYKKVIIPVNGKTNFTIKMEDDALKLETVVVTAMGIKKKEASLTYSTQQLNGDELNKVKDANMINSLAGKSAGVQITKSSSGLGGSAKVSIRGARSAFASGNNQPLYVIDGVPMLNITTESTATVMGGENDGVNHDSGDGVSNLNPDDIESMSILKGASAAALYGSQAANGVILITTKSGKAGMSRVTFSSNLTVDHAVSLPEFQNNYGQTADGTSSWGDKGNLTDYDNVGNWFGNGITAINSLTFQTGNDKMQTYFSYANTRGTGIVDSNKLQKHNITFRETASFFNDRLKLDGNASLMTQTIRNTPAGGGYYLNPLVGLYSFPRGADLAPYAENFEVFDTDRNMNLQNWYTKNEDGSFSEWDQNPYWIKNRVTNKSKRYRALASISANIKATDWLSIQARGNVDYVSDKFDNKMYASTAANIAGKNDETGLPNGRYVWSDEQNFQVYGDFMAMFNKTFSDFSINAALGTSINVSKANSLMIDSKTASLYRPNVFTVSNIIFSSKGYINQTIDAKRTIQSLFGTAQVGWKDAIYLDITARNDWSSTLANTESMKNGFFYPSVGVTWLLNETLKLPSWIDLGKIRGAWSKVGNGLNTYTSNPLNSITKSGSINFNSTAPFAELKPEMTTSIEFGTEWRFFNSRLEFDFTYYKTNTKNQLFTLDAPSGSQYARYYINAGDIQNTGVEVMLNGTPVMTKDFRWKTGVNFATNKNEAKALAGDDFGYFTFSGGESNNVWSRLEVGGSFGDIYGTTFVRDEKGNIQYEPAKEGQKDSDRLPLVDKTNPVKLGNSTPDFNLGWSNTITWKDFSLYFLIDGRFGGEVMSLTEADLDQQGVSKATGDARDRGYVMLEGRQITDVEGFYNQVGGRAGVTEHYMYSATNIRLRELSIGYSLPQAWLAKTGVIKNAQVSLVGRNLFFFKNNAPYDPDGMLSTSNRLQGVDVFGMPTNRSIGFNLKVNF